jgi:hypothetical protein
MQNLIELLERKNLCFKNFYDSCNQFLDECSNDNLQNLEAFQTKRQALLNVIDKIDAEIDSYLKPFKNNQSLFNALCTSEIKTKIQYLEREKKGLITAIIELDKQILEKIKTLKEETIKKLHAIQSSKRTLSAYKSPIDNIETEEGIKIIDHKA